MIDLHDLRKRPDVYQQACDKKLIKFQVAEFLELDTKYRAIKADVEALRARQNSFSKALPKLSGNEKDEKLSEMKEISERLKEKSVILNEIEIKWQTDQLLLPSIPHPKVKQGKDEADNVEIKRWGEIRKFDFDLKDHVQLGKELDILDLERGPKVSGARNYFLKGDGARLQHALISFALDLLHKKKYTLMDPPHIVKYECMMGTGYFPGGEEQAYHLDERDNDFHLIGTSEVSVCSYRMDEILKSTELPLKYAGFSPCYRREAGTYGKDTHGVYRIHQFYKVEQVIICKASEEESERLHAELLANAEELIQALDIPYRVVDCCTAELGRGQVFKNDIESWMPSRNGYGETHSCSTFHDFQARRLGIRYKEADGKNIYCHTLNNTLVASPRILIPLIELGQNKDGSVCVPKVLRPYMGGQEMIVRAQ